MTTLPNGCSRSDITVSPKNWKSKKASVKTDWRVLYWFYSPAEKKRIQIKGMNQARSLEERQVITQEIIENELRLLNSGYNPILKKMVAVEDEYGEISPFTPFTEALKKAYDYIEVSASTKASLISSMDRFVESSLGSPYSILPVSDVQPRHLLMLLKKVEKEYKLSPSNYNHYRSYLLMLFKALFLHGAVPSNPVRDIPKRKEVKRLKEVLDSNQRKLIDQHLYKEDYNFWRYIHIFFHSGARASELMKVKAAHVDLAKQRFKVTVMKGRTPFESWKTIKDTALPLWRELWGEAKESEHYLFSTYLAPGKAERKPERVYRRWKKLVKEGLGISEDLYSLKHLNSTEIVDLLSTEDAAHMNSHASTDMVAKVYDIRRNDRQHERLKKVDNKFS